MPGAEHGARAGCLLGCSRKRLGQACAECGDGVGHGTDALMHGGASGIEAGNYVGEAGMSPPQRVEGLETLEEPLPRGQRLQAPRRPQPVAGGDVAALDRFGGLPAGAVQGIVTLTRWRVVGTEP